MKNLFMDLAECISQSTGDGLITVSFYFSPFKSLRLTKNKDSDWEDVIEFVCKNFGFTNEQVPIIRDRTTVWDAISHISNNSGKVIPKTSMEEARRIIFPWLNGQLFTDGALKNIDGRKVQAHYCETMGMVHALTGTKILFLNSDVLVPVDRIESK